MTCSWDDFANGKAVVTSDDMGLSSIVAYASGVELKVVNVGDGVSVTFFLPDWDEVDPDSWVAVATRVNDDYSIDYGPPLHLEYNELGFVDLTGAAYLGNNVCCLTSQNEYDPVVFVSVNTSTLALTEVGRIESGWGSGAPDETIVISKGDGRGMVLFTRGFNPDALAWVSTDGATVSVSFNDATSAGADAEFPAALYYGRYCWASSGELVMPWTPGLRSYNIDFDARTVSLAYTVDMSGLNTVYFGDADVIPGVAPGTVDLLSPTGFASAPADTMALFVGVPIDGSSVPSPTYPLGTTRIGNYGDAPFAAYNWLKRFSDGTYGFTYARQTTYVRFIARYNPSSGVLTQHQYGLDGGFNFYDAEWWRNVSTGRSLLVFTGNNDAGETVIYWRSDCDFGAIPPLRQNQRDDIRQGQRTSRQLTVRQVGYL